MKATFKTITIKPHDQTMAEFAAICNAVICGEKVKPEEPQYSFTSFEAFRKAMNPLRFALLKVIRENKPESVKELAAITNRDMKNISEDVKILGSSRISGKLHQNGAFRLASDARIFKPSLKARRWLRNDRMIFPTNPR